MLVFRASVGALLSCQAFASFVSWVSFVSPVSLEHNFSVWLCDSFLFVARRVAQVDHGVDHHD